MGTSTSVAQLSRKFGKLADGLRDTRAPLDKTALAVKRIMESSAASAGVLGTVPAGKRKPVGVRYNVRSQGNGASVAVISYTGPAHLLNNPTSQHFIGASGFGSRSSLAQAGRGIGAVTAFGGSGRGMLTGLSQRRRRRGRAGARALTINADLRPWAFHPGTAGLGFFQRAKPAAVKAAPLVYGRTGLTGPLREAFAA